MRIFSLIIILLITTACFGQTVKTTAATTREIRQFYLWLGNRNAMYGATSHAYNRNTKELDSNVLWLPHN